MCVIKCVSNSQLSFSVSNTKEISFIVPQAITSWELTGLGFDTNDTPKFSMPITVCNLLWYSIFYDIYMPVNCKIQYNFKCVQRTDLIDSEWYTTRNIIILKNVSLILRNLPLSLFAMSTEFSQCLQSFRNVYRFFAMSTDFCCNIHVFKCYTVLHYIYLSLLKQHSWYLLSTWNLLVFYPCK